MSIRWNSKRWWKNQAETYRKMYQEKYDAMEEWKAEVLEKETVKSLSDQLVIAKQANEVLASVNNVLRDCNDTLTDALKKLH